MSAGRALLSCSLCRQRKLKCDRNVPCSNCFARKTDCIFSPQARDRNRVSGLRTEAREQVDARLHRLEQLVKSMISSESLGQALNVNGTCEQPVVIPSGDQKPSPDIESGRIMTSNHQTVYVSGAHWASICYEVTDIREYLDQANPLEPENILVTRTADGPLLLDGSETPTDMEAILSDIPPQDITNKLVSRYFTGVEFPSVIIHTPTFDQEYRDFWLRPEQVPLPWLGLLFGVMTMGAFLYTRSKEGLPDALGAPTEVMTAFHRRATQCLLLSKYSTSPGPYTIEALLVSQQFEFVRSKDARLGVWLMGGVIIRLAMRMGYHRDPDAYPRISVHQGEIRRRIWILIVQLDALTSYQMGLPAMVQDLHCDTKPPRNLFDEDFGPASTQLPPSRPETELTPVLHVINKAKLSFCFREIFSRVLLGGSDDYREIMELHQRLLAAHESVSPRLRLGILQDTVTVPPHLLLRRCTLELLFQKCLCMLHRRHMTKSFTNPDFSLSRSLCVEAAMRILTIQSDMFDEKKFGQILRESKGLISSLEQTDFILAATIVCLELGSRTSREPSLQDPSYIKFTTQSLVEALHSSHRHLATMKDVSEECQQAYEIVSVMVRKSGLMKSSEGVEEDIQAASVHSDSSRQYAAGDGTIFPTTCNTNTSWLPDFTAESSAQTILSSNAGPQTRSDPFSPSLFDTSTIESIESFFNDPESANWDFWETYIRNPRSSADV